MKIISGNVYFTIDEVAKLLEVNVRTVQRWLTVAGNRPDHAPQLTPHVFPNGRRYFKREDIENAYKRIGVNVSEDTFDVILREYKLSSSKNSPHRPRSRRAEPVNV